MNGASTLTRLKPGLRSVAARLGRTDEQWARVVMNREVRHLVSTCQPTDLSVLEISGCGWSDAFEFRSYRTVDYPEFDLCDASLDERFDLIIAEQVFEHLLWPYRAGRNAYSMLAPGGRLLVTTPFLVKVHAFPEDCSRWTETGLRNLLVECGFPEGQIRTGSWGNRRCVRSNLSGWTHYWPRLHSLRNEPDFPVVVWSLATKSNGDVAIAPRS